MGFCSITNVLIWCRDRNEREENDDECALDYIHNVAECDSDDMGDGAQVSLYIMMIVCGCCPQTGLGANMTCHMPWDLSDERFLKLALLVQEADALLNSMQRLGEAKLGDGPFVEDINQCWAGSSHALPHMRTWLQFLSAEILKFSHICKNACSFVGQNLEVLSVSLPLIYFRILPLRVCEGL
jgi:hypothetical protein